MTRVSKLRVGMIGYSFMGAAHSQAWRTVGHFFDIPVAVELAVLCGREEAALTRAATRMGWADTSADWRAVVGREDVDIIDICTPNSSHAEISIAALEAGKHVLCEKPLATTLVQAEAMADAASAARRQGTRSMVGFNYRRVPAIALLCKIIGEGRLGRLRHVRAVYLQDWASDPEVPLSWRMEASQAGSGALGDLGSHLIDLVAYLTGSRLQSVSASTSTFITQRRVAGSDALGDVTVDDAAVFLGHLSDGVTATFETSRVALGRKNSLRLEINGSLASAAFDLERLNELQLYEGNGSQERGFTTILVTEPDHPYLSAWWPPGHGLGYEHTFTHQAYEFLSAIVQERDPEPSFADGRYVQDALDAVARSAESSAGWVDLPAELIAARSEVS